MSDETAPSTPAPLREPPDLNDPMFQQLSAIMEASGITINGDQKFDPQVHHPDLAKRVASSRSSQARFRRRHDCDG